ncbi:peroxisomal membrane protein PEX14 [Teleopsis dalmanni]|uniref:peroxisomal membrane protein PEX14 n=1 Tax=Teleopsis dalmanni TaxID=139649 RepID=UPI0018CCC3BA|nr:peroxisomal membrane protein PEX14 [Teleopsis dalmanni]
MSSNTDTGDTILETELKTSELNSLLPPREALITTAVNFLQNAKVRHTTLKQKQQFLRSKGLTSEEIQLACERAGVFSKDPNAPTVINMDISSQTHSQLSLLPQTTTLGRIKEILNSVALVSGLAYAIYLFWKKYLEPFLFGKKKKKPVEDVLEDIDKKVNTRFDEVNQELTQIKDTLSQQKREHTQHINREFNNFKSDIEAIKGLLLNRKQFASPLTTGSPLIPAWQLSSAHRHRHSQSDDNEKADDAGSGSGSSETEVVTKNSDSSLEIV